MTAGTPPDGGHRTTPSNVHRPGHGTGDHAVHRIAGCPDPDCPAPAEVYAEAAVGSTHGPVPHARTFCLNRHFYQLPVERIPGYAGAGPVTSAPANRCEGWRPE